MRKIAVILSYPQVVFREGIHFILSGEEDFAMVGEATSNREAFELVEANLPDIVILSQKDREVSGVEMTRRIKRLYPSVAVILIADKEDSEQAFAALISGINASFTPDTEPDNLVTVIRDVVRGRLPVIEDLFTPELATRALIDFQDLATLSERLDIPMAQLTPKEVEVLSSLASGSDSGQVAAKLDLTEDAVRDQLRIILHKLVANDRTRAIIEGTQRTLPVLITGSSRGGGESPEYLTRAEFKEFKESLTATFKSLVSEKP